MNTSYSIPVDAPKKFKLESAVAYASWRVNAARPETYVPIEVGTIFVASGAKIEVTVKSEKGKKGETVKGTVDQNRFFAEVFIPAKVQTGDTVFFEVKLPKHGVKFESDRIPVLPPYVVTSMKWSKTEIRREETVQLTAQFEELPEKVDAKIHVLEYDPDRGIHDLIAQFPVAIENQKLEVEWMFQYPDDTLQIPTENEMQPLQRHYVHPQFFFVIEIEGVRIGRNQESGLLKFIDEVEFELRTEGGDLLPEQDVILKFPDGSEKQTKSDANGVVKLKDTPAGPVKVDVPD